MASQHAARDSMLRSAGAAVTPERIRMLVAQGRVDEAAGLVAKLPAGSESDVVRLRVHLTRQDYAAAAPLLAKLAALPKPDEHQRQALYEGLYARDDAAEVDRRTRGVKLTPDAEASVADLLAAGRLAYDLLDYARAESCFTRVTERATSLGPSARAAAGRGLGLVAYKRRQYDQSLTHLTRSVEALAGADNLLSLAETLIRLGRTDEAITASEWAITLNPYHDAHYLLGNGYARRNYTELVAAYPRAFADSVVRRQLGAADQRLASGDRAGARSAYEGVARSHPGRVDPLIRLASLDFEDGQFAAARDRCFAALTICPEYGRAHAVLAKALESQRFEVDVHRPEYEKRFAAMAIPPVPGIERFVINWKSLAPRHQKRIALSVKPWAQFIPVLVEGGSTYYIKPLYMLLSETPGLETLRDTRIDYDSRLWDDVRGAGGYHTVTGIEDVERTIFDRYDTVLHELTHQVHAVLTADQSRRIEELYRAAKTRDDSNRNSFLSRYAGGSVYEYFAEGANALGSPKRDAYDPREVVRERLDAMDPALREEVKKLQALTDVSASYPVAYVGGGNDRLERGEVEPSIPWFEKALQRNSTEETALTALSRAYVLGGNGAKAVETAARARRAHPTSGSVASAAAAAEWHAKGDPLAAAGLLNAARPKIRAEDLIEVDLSLASYQWTVGDGRAALAASDSALARQSDHPEGLWNRAASLALLGRWDEAFNTYESAVRLRTGVVSLRCDFARDLILGGRLEQARTHLDEARLLDPENPNAEALRGWLALAAGKAGSARVHARQALAWGEWCDLARLVLGAAESKLGSAQAAEATWQPVRERIARKAPPEFVYRKSLSTWERVHELPAVERQLLGTVRLDAK